MNQPHPSHPISTWVFPYDGEVRKYVEDSTEKYRAIARSRSTALRLDGRADENEAEKRLTTVTSILASSSWVVEWRKNSSPLLSVDVGCGSGGFFELILETMGNNKRGRVIGICPTKEELHFLGQTVFPPNVELRIGTSERLPALPQRVDFLFCNAVFLGSGFTAARVESSLREFHSSMKPGGLLFVGEIPDDQELGQSGSSLFRDVVGLLRLARLRSRARFLKRGRKLLRSVFSNDLEIVSTAPGFYCSSRRFTQFLEDSGFELLETFVSSDGESTVPRDSPYGVRLDYLARAL